MTRIFVICLLIMTVAAASAATINVQAVIDHDSELVITSTGLFWNHNGGAKPGYYGTSYQIPGPTYIDGIAWNPTWSTSGNRAAGTSSIYLMDLSHYTGWSLSTQYDGYFGSYPEFRNGVWQTLSQSTILNRGIIFTSAYNGYSTIHFQDYADGQNVYSFNLQTMSLPSPVPEPSCLILASLGISAGLALRRKW